MSGFTVSRCRPGPGGLCDLYWLMGWLNGVFVLGVGVGISIGTALTTNVGSTKCSDYTMVGDSINIASRLQGQAAAGEVLVTEDVYKMISAAFPGAVRVEYLLKGISPPVGAYRLVRNTSGTVQSDDRDTMK